MEVIHHNGRFLLNGILNGRIFIIKGAFCNNGSILPQRKGFTLTTEYRFVETAISIDSAHLRLGGRPAESRT